MRGGSSIAASSSWKCWSELLLWAILARTKIKDMSPKMQSVAFKLLTPEEIFRINGGALGLIPRELMDKAFDNLPPVAQRVMRVEACLREMLTKAASSYEELERIAVLQGEPPFEEGDRQVPLGRWSYHPDGYFIRYFPCGYKRMIIELYVPEPIKVERDSLGRIISISDQVASRLEISYNDALESPLISGEPSLRGYAFKALRFESWNIRPSLMSKNLKNQKEWIDKGWTFLGIPSGSGKINSVFDRFSDLQERYEMALGHKMVVDDLVKGINALAAGQEISQDGLKEIMDLGHCVMAVQKIIGRDNSEWDNWMLDPMTLIKMAWQSAVSKHMSVSKGTPIFNPGEDPVPGKAGSQRLGGSGRTTSPFNKCLDDYENCKANADKDLENRLDLCKIKYPSGEEWEALRLMCEFFAREKHDQDMQLCKSFVSACVKSATGQ